MVKLCCVGSHTHISCSLWPSPDLVNAKREFCEGSEQPCKRSEQPRASARDWPKNFLNWSESVFKKLFWYSNSKLLLGLCRICYNTKQPSPLTHISTSIHFFPLKIEPDSPILWYWYGGFPLLTHNKSDISSQLVQISELLGKEDAVCEMNCLAQGHNTFAADWLKPSTFSCLPTRSQLFYYWSTYSTQLLTYNTVNNRTRNYVQYKCSELTNIISIGNRAVGDY